MATIDDYVLGCGCCRGPEQDRCCCWIHQDTPRGFPPKKCTRHAELTYDIAKLIVHNPAAYTHDRARDAAVFVLGTADASQEDCIAAGDCLGPICRKCELENHQGYCSCDPAANE